MDIMNRQSKPFMGKPSTESTGKHSSSSSFDIGSSKIWSGKKKGESSSSAPPREHRCFVGGLSKDWDDAKLREAFAPFGITGGKVVSDRATAKSKGFGFVTFCDEESMQTAIHAMHGSDVDGRTLIMYEEPEEPVRDTGATRRQTKSGPLLGGKRSSKATAGAKGGGSVPAVLGAKGALSSGGSGSKGSKGGKMSSSPSMGSSRTSTSWGLLDILRPGAGKTS